MLFATVTSCNDLGRCRKIIELRSSDQPSASNERTGPGSVKAEGDFDWGGYRDGLVVGAEAWPEAPGADRFDGLFIKAGAESFCYADVGDAAIGGDRNGKQNAALVFRLHSFFRVLRIGAINADRVRANASPIIVVSLASTAVISRSVAGAFAVVSDAAARIVA